MDNFEEKLLNDVQQKILQGIQKCEFITVDYANRVKIPVGLVQEAYKSLDVNKIRERIKENLENEMADKITNKLITEYSNDIKQIMSNKELREDLRSYARNIIKQIADNVSSDTG